MRFKSIKISLLAKLVPLLIFAACGKMKIVNTKSLVNAKVGPVTQLVVSTSPSLTGDTDHALTVQPVLTAKTAANAVATNYAGVVTFNSYSSTNCSGGLVAGGVSTGAQVNASGLVSFSNLVKIVKTSVKSIQATDGSLTSACINTFAISPGAAKNLVFSTTPSASATSGIVFTQQPVVTVTDANSNLVGAGVAVNLASAPGTATFACTSLSANTDASGVSTFAGCKLTGSVGNYGITASSGAATPVTYNSVALSASAATQLVITTTPSLTGNTDTALATQPTRCREFFWC